MNSELQRDVWECSIGTISPRWRAKGQNRSEPPSAAHTSMDSPRRTAM
jgi:hypothetical protein